jgi:hypothetical protein
MYFDMNDFCSYFSLDSDIVSIVQLFSAYYREGGARGEKEKCLRLTSLTLTNKEGLVREAVPKNCSCGANGGSGYVHGDRVTVMVGKHKGQTGVVQGFTSSGKSAYVLLDGEGGARGKEETCLRLTWLNDAHYQVGRHGVTTKK